MKRGYWLGAALALLVLWTLPSEAAGPVVPQPQQAYRILLPSVAGPAAAVRVWKQSSASTANGTLVVSGEVVNTLSQPAYLVYVTVRGYDQAGQVIATKSEHTLLVHTPPGGRNPFRVELAAAASSIASYDITLSWSLQNRSSFRTLTLLGEQIVTSDALEVRGRVRNNDQKSIRDGAVAITFYDANDNVVDAAYAEIGAQRITSGSTATYLIRITRPVSYARYEIRAEGSIAPEGSSK